jgi:hypothetical protein
MAVKWKHSNRMGNYFPYAITINPVKIYSKKQPIAYNGSMYGTAIYG